MVARRIMAAVWLALLLFASACCEEPIDSLTYAVFPYLPDMGYYQALIERRCLPKAAGCMAFRSSCAATS